MAVAAFRRCLRELEASPARSSRSGYWQWRCRFAHRHPSTPTRKSVRLRLRALVRGHRPSPRRACGAPPLHRSFAPPPERDPRHGARSHPRQRSPQPPRCLGVLRRSCRVGHPSRGRGLRERPPGPQRRHRSPAVAHRPCGECRRRLPDGGLRPRRRPGARGPRREPQPGRLRHRRRRDRPGPQRHEGPPHRRGSAPRLGPARPDRRRVHRGGRRRTVSPPRSATPAASGSPG